MEELAMVFDFVFTCISAYVLFMYNHWYTTILFFLAIMSGIVSVYLSVRGSK